MRKDIFRGLLIGIAAGVILEMTLPDFKELKEKMDISNLESKILSLEKEKQELTAKYKMSKTEKAKIVRLDGEIKSHKLELEDIQEKEEKANKVKLSRIIMYSLLVWGFVCRGVLLMKLKRLVRRIGDFWENTDGCETRTQRGFRDTTHASRSQTTANNDGRVPSGYY